MSSKIIEIRAVKVHDQEKDGLLSPVVLDILTIRSMHDAESGTITYIATRGDAEKRQTRSFLSQGSKESLWSVVRRAIEALGGRK